MANVAFQTPVWPSPIVNVPPQTIVPKLTHVDSLVYSKDSPKCHHRRCYICVPSNWKLTSPKNNIIWAQYLPDYFNQKV